MYNIKVCDEIEVRSQNERRREYAVMKEEIEVRSQNERRREYTCVEGRDKRKNSERAASRVYNDGGRNINNNKFVL